MESSDDGYNAIQKALMEEYNLDPIKVEGGKKIRAAVASYIQDLKARAKNQTKGL